MNKNKPIRSWDQTSGAKMRKKIASKKQNPEIPDKSVSYNDTPNDIPQEHCGGHTLTKCSLQDSIDYIKNLLRKEKQLNKNMKIYYRLTKPFVMLSFCIYMSIAMMLLPILVALSLPFTIDLIIYIMVSIGAEYITKGIFYQFDWPRKKVFYKTRVHDE